MTEKNNKAGSWRVVWHPDAELERDNARPDGEILAMHNAVEKLESLGTRLARPHMRDVNGPDGEGLWELRPRGGKSKWRPIYKRVNRDTFVILAVAPEFDTNKRGYKAALKRAQTRLVEIEI